ncbi:hypothetical protein N431DRAFT_555554 [Stipitochalara longipes BDJ]|nr:hypothetical protein N431DRAFT_555554 [Stipitochalara longipes BDJ]
MSNSEPDLEYTRLHITPLNPFLLTTILPASILPSARNISYHSIQTFPEKSYGYVDLPMADAEKIKKKLNGSILKGTKVRIEKARLEKEKPVEKEDEPERPKKERKKRKRDQLEVPGIDIGERQVKRGWTTPTAELKGKGKEKEKVAKSKFTTQPECLFKTVLPPNKVANAKGKLKKSKDKKKGKETLVHEFERTVKYATFLRAPGGRKTKGVVEYVEGKGWVDEDGSVVEVVKIRKELVKVAKPAVMKEESEEESEEESSEDSSEGSSEDEADAKQTESKIANEDEDSTSDDSSSEEELNHKVVASSIPITKVEEESSEESSSEDSSSEEESDHLPVASSSKVTKKTATSDESSEESSSESEDEVEEPQSAITSRPQSSSGPGLTIKIPDSITSTPIASSVHPLEALYKRKSDEQPKAGPSFSFFGDNEDEDVAVETHLQVPLTPFTQKDFEYRGIRSAAPTPDTAHANKKFVWPTDNDDDDEEEQASSPIREPKGKEKEAEPESDFQKWFWENRGNVNRAWKKRRKVVAKEKRQRENRKRQDRLHDFIAFGVWEMEKFGKICLRLKKARWSPPLHSTMEISAPSQLRPESSTCSGDVTPIMSSASSSSSLPSYKLPPTQIPTATSRFQKLLQKTRSFKLLDSITNVAGSRLVFLGTLALLLVWTILGIVLGATDIWQIVMQNASSIQCYVSDTLLMRQQANATHSFLVSIAEMRSRSASCLRMLRSLSPSQLQELKDLQGSELKEPSTLSHNKERKEKKVNFFDRACDIVALATGSLPALTVYLIGTFVWLGLGPLFQWGNIWQLYINTAVAVELTFTSMFLQNVRRRHSDTLSRTLSSIRTLDSSLELRLREMTCDTAPNPTIVIAPPETTRTERFIDVYAYIVGSGVGVALTSIIVITWLALGHLLMWDSNWWLIIGTYTGLVGFVDGFVLRNVYFRQSAILETHLQALVSADQSVFSFLGLPFFAGNGEEDGEGQKKKSLGLRISEGMIYYCAMPSAVIGSLVVVLILLAIATGLRWSETGQLLCNTPTMIVEGFLLLVLFQAHNLASVERRGQIGRALERRGRIGGLLGVGTTDADCGGVGRMGNLEEYSTTQVFVVAYRKEKVNAIELVQKV